VFTQGFGSEKFMCKPRNLLEKKGGEMFLCCGRRRDQDNQQVPPGMLPTEVLEDARGTLTATDTH
jgi:hypothetical protein